MSLLDSKSSMSEKGANSLHEMHLFPSSVHCAYYRCYQKMLHIAFNILGEDENKLRAEQKTKQANQGAHEFLINFFTSKIRNKNRHDSNNFNNWMIQLKRKRHDADYREIEITIDDSLSAINLSNKITKILTTNF